MVLLTSSTISVIISSGIVCTFTFLLFLSGYVLQQQTVRSLQDALRNPPERYNVPTPALSPQFQTTHDDDYHVALSGADQKILSAKSKALFKGDARDERSVREMWYDHVRGEDPTLKDDTKSMQALEEEKILGLEMIASIERLAYIFALSDTNSLCSAAAFASKHKNQTRLMVQPKVVFIYPANWDVSDKQHHMAAMDLLRDLQDDIGVVLHPVTISRVWTGISIEQQLLAELQRYRWPYDRAMFLGSPGMTLDTAILDRALALSDTRSAWTLLHTNPNSYEASNPPLLLFVAGRGLLYPRQDMKSLTSRAIILTTKPQAKRPADVQALNAAYIWFDEKELDFAQNNPRYSIDLIERFERDRSEACIGTGLMGT